MEPLGSTYAWGTISKPKKKKEIPQSLNPLTEEEWSHFDGKARWDSIVALRGPDLANSDTLKYFTTSVIRYRLSKVMRVGGMVNRQLPFVVIGPEPGKGGQFDASHFYYHILEAARWLGIPIVQCSAETWAAILKGEYFMEILKRLYGEVPDGSIKSTIATLAGLEVPTPCPE